MIRILWMSVRFGMSYVAQAVSLRRKLTVCVTGLALQGRNILHNNGGVREFAED
jgi:hypothetical protein